MTGEQGLHAKVDQSEQFVTLKGCAWHGIYGNLLPQRVVKYVQESEYRQDCGHKRTNVSSLTAHHTRQGIVRAGPDEVAKSGSVDLESTSSAVVVCKERASATKRYPHRGCLVIPRSMISVWCQKSCIHCLLNLQATRNVGASSRGRVDRSASSTVVDIGADRHLRIV